MTAAYTPVGPSAPGTGGPSGSRGGRPRDIEPSDEHRERLETIITVAAELFWKHGYDGASLDTVAAAAGLRKSSLYHYVSKKSELLRLVFDRALKASEDDFDDVADIVDPGAELAALIRRQIMLATQNQPLFAVVYDQRWRLDPADAPAVRRAIHRYIDRLIEVVLSAMDAGVLPRGDARSVANSIIGMTGWSYRWFDPERDSAEVFADSCVRLIIRSAASAAGTTRAQTPGGHA